MNSSWTQPVQTAAVLLATLALGCPGLGGYECGEDRGLEAALRQDEISCDEDACSLASNESVEYRVWEEGPSDCWFSDIYTVRLNSGSCDRCRTAAECAEEPFVGSPVVFEGPTLTYIDDFHIPTTKIQAGYRDPDGDVFGVRVWMEGVLLGDDAVTCFSGCGSTSGNAVCYTTDLFEAPTEFEVQLFDSQGHETGRRSAPWGENPRD